MADPSWLPTNQNQDGDFTVLCARNTAVDQKIATFLRKRRIEIGKGETAQGQIGKETARIQSCYCYEGRARSLTVRTDYKFKESKLVSPLSDPYSLKWSGYQPSPKVSQGFLVSPEQTCTAVFTALGLGASNLNSTGLVVISGSTGSLKTVLALGLIQMRLEALMNDWASERRKPHAWTKRKPHLVTCEDNIESYFMELENLQWLEKVWAHNPDAYYQQETWLTRADMPDYTPRKIGVDTGSLRDGVDDALRMKPAIFYGGEIRKPGDWSDLYRLAQSHFVVVTTHASSLVTTFAMLQNNLGIRTSAQRSEFAASIQAVVHMRAGELRGTACLDGKPVTQDVQFVLPSCWVRTPVSIAAYTSDGAASLIPEYTELPEHDGMGLYCIGRASFADRLGAPRTAAAEAKRKWNKSAATKAPVGDGRKDLKCYTKAVKSDKWHVTPDFVEELVVHATKWDLIGA